MPNKSVRERVAEELHKKYNELAIKAGWKIQTCCETPFECLPTANQEVMLGMADYVMSQAESQLQQLTLGEEEIMGIINQLKNLSVLIGMKYDTGIPEHLAREAINITIPNAIKALSTTLKPSYLSILEKNVFGKEGHQEHCRFPLSDCSCKLKPSWTELEKDNLGKAIDTIRGDKNLNYWSLQQHAETLKALDVVLNFCKQALLG